MSTRCNRHVKKYNQLVEVYDPAGLEQIGEVESEEAVMLEARGAEIEVLRERAEELTVADFFSESERTAMREDESMPDLETVAESQRSDLVERLAEIERALNAALTEASALEESDTDLG